MLLCGRASNIVSFYDHGRGSPEITSPVLKDTNMWTNRSRRPASKTVRSTTAWRIVRASLLVAALAFPAVWFLLPVSAANLPVGFTQVLYASGITTPTTTAMAPDGRIFVCQQNGILRVIKNGTLLPDPFLTLAVNQSGERGLLGVAFDPDFSTNHWVYVYYTANSPTIHNRVSRFTANGDVAVADSELILLELDNLTSADITMEVQFTLGPMGNSTPQWGTMRLLRTRSSNNMLGKILRIDANGSIPTDNRFFNTASGNNRSIWSLGLRNPFTFTFQPGTGRMFINDVGLSLAEEIDDGIAGANYGWPNCEGACEVPGFTDPIFQYGHQPAGGQPPVAQLLVGPSITLQMFSSQQIMWVSTSLQTSVAAGFVGSIQRPAPLCPSRLDSRCL